VSRLKPKHEWQVISTEQQENIEESCICGRRIEATGVLSQSGITSKTREKEQTIEYGSCQVMLIARFIQDLTMNVNQHGPSFAQQYILQKGLKVFGKKGHDASKKEIDQLHKRTCFAPLKVKEMKPSERKKAQMALMFLTEKRDKSIKGRMV
jgi:hypothetical protein